MFDKISVRGTNSISIDINT